ncbi:MAG: sigma-70 family RNA polymerase sigma factor [Synergistaceae bacterium]|nr:sigma-70 family RNA polymerase sigma factor [Synergistaceae bacterium]
MLNEVEKPEERKDIFMQEDVLMTRIANGDEESFAQLYELWRRRVMAYAFRSLRDIYEAQDVVQETFMQLYRAAPSYRAEGKFPAFVLRIAGNLVRLRFRNKKNVDSLTEMLDDESQPMPESLSYSPEEGIINSIDIDSILKTIPARQKEALILTASGISYSEGAEMMEITQDAFAQLVLRGRRSIKVKMMRMSDLS